MNHQHSLKILLAAIVVSALVNVAQAQSKDRDNPTRLNSNEISGLIDSESKGSVYYYSFFANPGEVAISISVESNRPVNAYVAVSTVSFTLYDRNAEAILEREASSYFGGGTSQAIGRVNIVRRQPVILALNVPEGPKNGTTGRYRVKVSGSVALGSDSVTTSAADPSSCLPKQGTLIVKMKDGSKRIIDLGDADTITIVP